VVVWAHAGAEATERASRAPASRRDMRFSGERKRGWYSK
jgi:hypothetical protein